MGQSPSPPLSRIPTQTLASIQILRGLAALLVVFFHAAAVWRDGVSNTDAGLFSGPWDQGFAGVDLFFVISGFIMVWITQDRAGGLRPAGRFAYDRVTRIYPLWWMFCGLMATYFWITYTQPASPDLVSEQEAGRTLLKSMTLWPQSLQPILTVGWTLTFELAFYALFAALMLCPPHWRLPILYLWGGTLIITMGLTPSRAGSNILPDTWGGVLLHPICLEFVFGACVAVLMRRFQISKGIAGLLLCGGLIGFGLSVSGLFQNGSAGMGGYDLGRVRLILYGLPATLILLGAVALEHSGGKPVDSGIKRVMVALGDASYSLYLCHLLVLLTLKRLIPAIGLDFASNWTSFVGFLLIGTFASVMVALVTYRLIEAPLLQLTKRLKNRPPSEGLT